LWITFHKKDYDTSIFFHKMGMFLDKNIWQKALTYADIWDILDLEIGVFGQGDYDPPL
jgi:hypothetical protein